MRAESASPFSIAFFTLVSSCVCSFSHFLDMRWICLAVNLMLKSWFSTAGIPRTLPMYFRGVLVAAINVVSEKITL